MRSPEANRSGQLHAITFGVEHVSDPGVGLTTPVRKNRPVQDRAQVPPWPRGETFDLRGARQLLPLG